MLPKTVEILIARDQSHFKVTVAADDLTVGYFINGEGDHFPYSLGLSEEEEAREKFAEKESNSQDDEPDSFPAHFATGREADDAANAHAGFLGMQSDRRNA